MFKKVYGFQQFTCLSSDVKQTEDINLASRLLVIDTQEQLIFDGDEWVVDTTKSNKTNILALSGLTLSSVTGSQIVVGQTLNLSNSDSEIDLFAWKWVNVTPDTDYLLTTDSAESLIYVYSDALYGNLLALLTPDLRTITVSSGVNTQVLVGFYLIAGLSSASFVNVAMKKG